MPSPITHVTVGYILGTLASRRAPDRRFGTQNRLVLVAVAVLLALLPDFDSALGLIVGDFGRYHHNLSHSVIVALAVALVVASVASACRAGRFTSWFVLTLAGYGSHVVLDYLTWGRGVMGLWPLTDERYSSPLTLFYGLHWSEGLVSRCHLWTVLTEGAFSGALVLAFHRLRGLASSGTHSAATRTTELTATVESRSRSVPAGTPAPRPVDP